MDSKAFFFLSLWTLYSAATFLAADANGSAGPSGLKPALTCVRRLPATLRPAVKISSFSSSSTAASLGYSESSLLRPCSEASTDRQAPSAQRSLVSASVPWKVHVEVQTIRPTHLLVPVGSRLHCIPHTAPYTTECTSTKGDKIHICYLPFLSSLAALFMMSLCVCSGKPTTITVWRGPSVGGGDIHAMPRL